MTTTTNILAAIVISNEYLRESFSIVMQRFNSRKRGLDYMYNAMADLIDMGWLESFADLYCVVEVDAPLRRECEKYILSLSYEEMRAIVLTHKR